MHRGGPLHAHNRGRNNYASKKGELKLSTGVSESRYRRPGIFFFEPNRSSKWDLVHVVRCILVASVSCLNVHTVGLSKHWFSNCSFYCSNRSEKATARGGHTHSTAATVVKKFWPLFLLLDRLTTLKLTSWPSDLDVQRIVDRYNLSSLSSAKTLAMDVIKDPVFLLDSKERVCKSHVSFWCNWS